MATTSKRSLVSRAKAALTRKPEASADAGPATTKSGQKSGQKSVKKAAAKSGAAKKTAAQNGAAKSAPAKKAATKSAATKSAATKKVATKKVAGKGTTQKSGTAKKAPAKAAAAPRKASPASTGAKSAAAAKKSSGNGVTTKRATATSTAASTPSTDKPSSRKSAAGKATSQQAGSTSGARLVVLEQEEPWTKQELAEVRNTLKADIKRLTGELAESEVELADMISSSDGAGQDTADIGSASFERDQEMTIVANARIMLEQSEHALERIADRTYGVCETCGNPIGKNRLMAFPRATMCLSCKQREERR